MEKKASCMGNVLRVLKEYGIGVEDLDVTKEDPARVWAWPRNHKLLDLVQGNRNGTEEWKRKWIMDPRFAAEGFHGTREAFREPGGPWPCLQVCVHYIEHVEGGEEPWWPYFVEMDLDLAPAYTVAGAIFHGLFEVVPHWLTRGETDQERVRKWLDRRFKEKG